MMRYARILTLTLLLVGVIAALPATAVFAQYPQPTGACTVTPPSPPFTPGSKVIFVVTALTDSGQPKVGLVGTVTVTGGTAAPAFTTNAQGKANIEVTVGANATAVNVSTTCEGVSGSSTINIVTPQPKPPDTGFGLTAEDGGSSFPYAWVFGGIASIGMAGAAAYAVARRR
jgi:hypothetical protein